MAIHSTHSAYDEPETPEEISRRRFMVNAVITMSGVIGLGLAIPILGGVIPSQESGSGGTWSPLTRPSSPSLKRRRRSP
jgi:hypothetical protein